MPSDDQLAEVKPMIMLKKLDKSSLLVNVDAIKFIESTPDTLIFFQNGDSLFVLETLPEVQQLVIKYKARVIANIEK
jgi:flagellar protein FlbD